MCRLWNVEASVDDDDWRKQNNIYKNRIKMRSYKSDKNHVESAK